MQPLWEKVKESLAPPASHRVREPLPPKILRVRAGGRHHRNRARRRCRRALRPEIDRQAGRHGVGETGWADPKGN